MRVVVLALVLSALGLAACKEPPPPPPPPPAFTPPRSYEGVALGTLSDDVVRTLGTPNVVGVLSGHYDFYAVSDNPLTSRPMQGSIEDYPHWAWVTPTRTIMVFFNHLSRVHAVTCTTGQIEGGCSPLDGVAMGATPQDAIAVVGGLMPTTPSSQITANFADDLNSTSFYIDRGRVIGAGIAVPGGASEAWGYDYSRVPR